jgi:DNA replicative helicase MCM subunit Mcm2 (Cdc46/Mcm family)
VSFGLWSQCSNFIILLTILLPIKSIRATVIAVMNPRDCIYDNQTSLSANTGLGTPLLSRFDLIFKLVDSPDPERDGNVTTYLLNRAIQVSLESQSQSSDFIILYSNCFFCIPPITGHWI